MASSSTAVYTFNPATSAGVSGAITVTYLAQGATISAQLNVGNANWTALTAAEPLCTGPVSEFTWHIHSKWTNAGSSAAFSGCSLAVAGNHFDPDLACGPNSEHISDSCKSVVAAPEFKYSCTAASYAANPKACEQGDLSGKLGKMKATDGQISGSWTDPNYPAANVSTPQWNMMLHAVCSTATPRFICATAANSGNGSVTIAPSKTTKPNTIVTPSPGNSTKSPTASSTATVKFMAMATAVLAVAAHFV
ncbi:hypothetical protein ACHHYP_06856 [Achlya hypogyna]|uniref:Uncharacterized protein n=1 Tax=Achlya hypogyna TaxID=1202772 RepID=A0A1V9YRE1_ACHHY|nr:hypothetical protein ACHHYP_06856 [Achlya hypogyna]